MTTSLKPKFIKLSKDSRLHQCPIPIIGLTGGIATGKTTASTFLSNKGFRVICADKLIKEIYALPNTLTYIKAEFPQVIEQDTINFKSLRSIAFSNQNNREKLEQFLYQQLPQQFNSSYSNEDKVIVYDVPLLFEKNLAKLVDYSLVIYTPREVQIKRLMERDHIEQDLAESILANQIDIEQKRSLADYSINNTSDLQTLEDSLNDWVSELFE
jgi:dephospho-CoA kinase